MVSIASSTSHPAALIHLQLPLLLHRYRLPSHLLLGSALSSARSCLPHLSVSVDEQRQNANEKIPTITRAARRGCVRRNSFSIGYWLMSYGSHGSRIWLIIHLRPCPCGYQSRVSHLPYLGHLPMAEDREEVHPPHPVLHLVGEDQPVSIQYKIEEIQCQSE